MKILFFDTETSGLKAETNKICQLSYIIIENNVRTSKNFFFKVGYIEAGAQNVHGFSVQKLSLLSKGKVFKDSFEEIYDDFHNVDILVGHNVEFDIKFITEEFKRILNRQPVLNAKPYCTMKLFTDIVKIPSKNPKFGPYKRCKLGEVVDFLNITNDYIRDVAKKMFDSNEISYHDARFDIAATFIILEEGQKKGYVSEDKILQLT